MKRSEFIAALFAPLLFWRKPAKELRIKIVISNQESFYAHAAPIPAGAPLCCDVFMTGIYARGVQ